MPLLISNVSFLPKKLALFGVRFHNKLSRFNVDSPCKFRFLFLLLSKFKSSNKNIYIIGMPSCAKSPKENGLDWVLWRILCNIDFKNSNLNELSVGGLIK